MFTSVIAFRCVQQMYLAFSSFFQPLKKSPEHLQVGNNFFFWTKDFKLTAFVPSKDLFSNGENRDCLIRKWIIKGQVRFNLYKLGFFELWLIDRVKIETFIFCFIQKKNAIRWNRIFFSLGRIIEFLINGFKISFDEKITREKERSERTKTLFVAALIENLLINKSIRDEKRGQKVADPTKRVSVCSLNFSLRRKKHCTRYYSRFFVCSCYLYSKTSVETSFSFRNYSIQRLVNLRTEHSMQFFSTFQLSFIF